MNSVGFIAFTCTFTTATYISYPTFPKILSKELEEMINKRIEKKTFREVSTFERLIDGYSSVVSPMPLFRRTPGRPQKIWEDFMEPESSLNMRSKIINRKRGKGKVHNLSARTRPWNSKPYNSRQFPKSPFGELPFGSDYSFNTDPFAQVARDFSPSASVDPSSVFNNYKPYYMPEATMQPPLLDMSQLMNTQTNPFSNFQDFQTDMSSSSFTIPSSPFMSNPSLSFDQSFDFSNPNLRFPQFQNPVELFPQLPPTLTSPQLQMNSQLPLSSMMPGQGTNMPMKNGINHEPPTSSNNQVGQKIQPHLRK